MPYLPHVRPDHDETLIARLAVDDLDPRQTSTARQLVAECPACAQLLHDLNLIAAATTALPPTTRTRDFRLTEADAARLRPGGWRGLVARFGTPGYAFTKPLGAGLATLGIAGLILASIPAGLGGSASSALAPAGGAAFDTTGGPVEAAGSPGSADGGGAKAVAGAAASPAALAPAIPPAAASGGPLDASSHAPGVAGGVTDQGNGSRDASPIPEAVQGAASTRPVATADNGSAVAGEGVSESTFGLNPLIVLSVTLLVVGLVLGGLRVLAGRLI